MVTIAKPEKRYKFEVERDVTFLMPKYTYIVYVSEDEGKHWYPMTTPEDVVFRTKKKAIETARADIADMQAFDRETKVVYEEEVTG